MGRKVPIKACIVCHSADLISDVDALDHDRTGYRQQEIGKDRNPNALLFKETETTGLYVVVCGSCGYVHYFAEDPESLRFRPNR